MGFGASVGSIMFVAVGQVINPRGNPLNRDPDGDTLTPQTVVLGGVGGGVGAYVVGRALGVRF